MPPTPASLLTIFGASGDLAQRMLLPSLYGLHRDGLLPPKLRILGTARTEFDDDAFRALVAQSIAEFVPAEDRNDAGIQGLLERIDYVPASLGHGESFQRLASAISARRDGDVVYHLSTAPRLYGGICTALSDAGVADAATRVLLEKPIGHDLASANANNDKQATSAA